MTLRQALPRLVAAFWTVPVLGALVALVGGWALVRLDEGLGGVDGLLFAGGPESARAILQTVATSVLTFAGLTFSITVVALQLASSQFSPRVLGPLLRDRWTRGALATFVGTFVHCLVVLREVRDGGDGDQAFVPGAAVGVALLLGLVSVGALVGFVHHTAQSLRVVTLVDRTFRATVETLDAWYDGTPDRGRPREGASRDLRAHRDGVLAALDRRALVGFAVEHDLTVEVLVAPGSWVVAGRPLLRLHGARAADDEVAAALEVDKVLGRSREREVGHDPAYGFRLLVDIAERALSPGVNDPTTAVQCLDRLHSLLARIADRDLDVGDTVVDGVVRLRLPVPDWADYLGLACDEVRHWGADSLRVHRRLEVLLDDLGRSVPVARRTAVERQVAALRAARDGAVADAWPLFSAHGDPAEALRHDG